MLLSVKGEGFMSVDYGGRRRFDLGRVFERTFGAIGANGLSLLLVALILVGLPQAALVWGQAQVSAAASDLMTAGVLVGLTAFVVSIVCNVVMQGVVTHAVVADLQGRKATVGESLNVALQSFWGLLAVGIVSGLAITLGLIILILPGILIFLMWFVAGPVIVAERAGFGQAFQRSRDLTRNHRWWLLLLAVIYVVLSWVIAAVVGMIGLAASGFRADGELSFVTLVFGPVAQAITTLLWSAIVAATYVELRAVKEGGGQTIASIFD